MAKLDKGFEDYFMIPILLKPIGLTKQSSLKKIYQMLSQQRLEIVIDQRYQPISNSYSKILQKRQKHVTQSICFRLTQFANQWSQFQVIYRCRFCVGVFDSDIGDPSEQWKKACKIAGQQCRKMVGLIIMSLNNCTIQDIKSPYIIIPKNIRPSQIFAFLQPWLFSILPIIQDHICLIIAELQTDQNKFIVFNKTEQKPQPRTLKKKKKGRCLKVCGDFCLVLQLVKQAYNYFVQAQEILKKIDDYLWILGCNQGKLACFITDFELQGKNKQQILQQVRQQCFNLATKIKIPQLQTQNYFKILKIYTKIPEPFDSMAMNFITYIIANYSSSQKFSALTQLSQLYKQAGMIRKHNYSLYLASKISMELKPSLAGMMLKQILKSGHIKQWPLINANVIKLLIDNGCDSREGLLHLDLLQSCCSVLSQKDIQITIQALQRRNFQLQHLQNPLLFTFVFISCLQSPIKPKLNKLASNSPSRGTSQGVFINWKKTQTIYQFQKGEPVTFQLKIRNNMNFPIRCSARLHFEGKLKLKPHSFCLQPKMNKITLQQKFEQLTNQITLQKIQFKIFNFIYIKKLNQFPPLKLQIYQQYPDLQIKIPEIFKNQQSSLFQLPLTFTRNKLSLNLFKIKITISIYYHVDVGFQQTQFNVTNLSQQKYLIVSKDYPYQQSDIQLIHLNPFKADKKHLKKIECKIDTIRQQISKYQITKISTCLCHFQRSIWCQLIIITTPTQINFNINDSNIIEESFTMKIAVHKKQDDLTPYKIIQSNQSYLLSDKTTVLIEKTLPKFTKEQKKNEKQLQISFRWINLLRQKQQGTIIFPVPIQPKMYLSPKHIQFTIQNWNKTITQNLSCPINLKINYTITSPQGNLSHNFIVQPFNLPPIKKYIVSGKIKLNINNCNKISNTITIKFFYQYQQSYMLGLKFEDSSIFWFPCLFHTIN